MPLPIPTPTHEENLALSRVVLIIKPPTYPSYAFAHTSHTHTHTFASPPPGVVVAFSFFFNFFFFFVESPTSISCCGGLLLSSRGCWCCSGGAAAASAASTRLRFLPILLALCEGRRGGVGGWPFGNASQRQAQRLLLPALSMRGAERPVGGGCCGCGLSGLKAQNARFNRLAVTSSSASSIPFVSNTPKPLHTHITHSMSRPAAQA